MVDITGINATPQQANRVSGRTANKTDAAKNTEAVSAVNGGDRIEISAGAKEAQTVQKLVSSAQSEPDVRPEAVARAKERLENGEYEGVDVSRQAAKNILGVL